MLVFVYGTLKSKYGNNRLLTGANLIREDRVHGYKLLNSGFPVAKVAEDCIITGEVCDIGEPTTDHAARLILTRLDQLEGYYADSPEHSMYTRNEVVTENGLQCNMYVGNVKSFQNNEDWPDDNKVYTWNR